MWDSETEANFRMANMRKDYEQSQMVEIAKIMYLKRDINL